MITVFTGSPGAGKTASLVDFLNSLYGQPKRSWFAGLFGVDSQTKPAEGQRPLFVDGLEGLTLPHTVVDANNWHNELPDGAILVIDEVQRVWRPRAAGSKVPESVSQLETHRHRGIDVFVTTQAPKLMDANVRALVGRHVHIRDTGILGRWWYEWPEISDSMNWKTCINKKRIKLSKKSFALYKSASIHTDPVRGVPRVLYVVVAALVMTAVLIYFGYRTISGRNHPVDVSPKQVAPVDSVPSYPVMAKVQAYDMLQFVPRISNRPESAPAYDHLRAVVAMPMVVGGACVGDDCKCVTQQGTDPGLTSEECRRWMANPPFNPYKAPQIQPADHRRGPDQNPQPIQVAQNMPKL